MSDTSLLDAARALAPRIRACAPEAEAARTLPRPLVREMAAAGFFRMLVPRAYGGGEVEPLTYVDVIEELSRADGAAGWCVLISTSSLYLCASRLRPDVAAAMFGDETSAIMAGSAVPRGRAVALDGGFRLSGRWTMGSNIQHSAWVMAGCIVHDGDTPRRGPEGAPEVRMAVFPASDAEVIDTWTSTGLRGTGSHDFAVHDLFVPAERTFARWDRSHLPGPLYALPFAPQLAHAAHALGLGRAALDAFLDLAEGKVPTWSPTRAVLRDRPAVQTAVAEVEALLGSARAYIEQQAGSAWATVCAGEQVSLPARARFRLAIVNAMTASLQAVDRLYRAAGASAVYAAGPLDRPFRDLHTAAAHLWVAPESYELAGKMLLGLDPGTAMI